MTENQGRERQLVTPGERLGFEEEFAAGTNTYADHSTGELRAKVVGITVRDWRSRILAVKPLKTPKYLIKSGDIVHAVVTGFKDSLVILQIFYIERGGVQLLTPLTGILPAANISSWRSSLYKDVLGYGDIVRAVVIEEAGPPYILSTRGREFGVILARCPRCLTPMVKRGGVLLCPRCRAKAKRKISSRYVKTR